MYFSVRTRQRRKHELNILKSCERLLLYCSVQGLYSINTRIKRPDRQVLFGKFKSYSQRNHTTYGLPELLGYYTSLLSSNINEMKRYQAESKYGS